MSVPPLDSAPNSLSSSLDVFVHQIQGELDELILRKANIRRQMRNLRRQLSGATTNDDPQQAPQKADSRRKGHRYQAKRVNSRTEQRMSLRLRRACRIALMELDGDATPEKIYSSIVRRGSFSFLNVDVDPIAVIIRTLEILATET